MEREGGSLVRLVPSAALCAAVLLSGPRVSRAEEGKGASALVAGTGGTASASASGVPAVVETHVVEATRPVDGVVASAAQEHVDLRSYAARAVHTGDVLERVPGVDVQSFGAIGQGSFVRIRGSTPAQVLVLVDGVRMNPIAGGGADLDSIPIELLDSVDVVRGAGAARWGADALGGVISFRTDPRRAGVAATATGGSTGSARVSASAIAGAGGWLFDATARHERAPETFRYLDGLRDEYRTRRNVDAQAVGAAAGARGAIAGGELVVRAWGTTLAAGAPGLSEHPTEEAHREEERVTGIARWEGASGGDAGTAWTLESSARAESMLYENPRPLLNTGTVRSRSRSTSVSAGAGVRHRVGTALLLSAGADAREERIDDLGFGKKTRQVAGGRASAALLLFGGRLELDAAMRAETATGAGDVGLTPLPSAGAVVRGEGWEIRAHGGRSFRLPTFTELHLPEMETAGGNPDLEPEDAWSGDAGFALETSREARHGASLEVTAFETLVDDAIVFAPVAAHRFKPVNTGRSWFYGVELAAGLRLPWASAARMSWTRTESWREETREPLPGRPRDRILASIGSHPLGGPVAVFAEAAWVSESYVDFFGNLAVPAGSQLAAGATVAPRRGSLSGFALTLEATNLTDADVRDALFFPQPGRAFWVTLRWRGPAGIASPRRHDE